MAFWNVFAVLELHESALRGGESSFRSDYANVKRKNVNFFFLYSPLILYIHLQMIHKNCSHIDYHLRFADDLLWHIKICDVSYQPAESVKEFLRELFEARNSIKSDISVWKTTFQAEYIQGRVVSSTIAHLCVKKKSRHTRREKYKRTSILYYGTSQSEIQTAKCSPRALKSVGWLFFPYKFHYTFINTDIFLLSITFSLSVRALTTTNVYE